jgi:hypothetical protein
MGAFFVKKMKERGQGTKGTKEPRGKTRKRPGQGQDKPPRAF